MNKERAKELLPIIEAFANGKVIEYLFVGEWRVATCPEWTPEVKYRIKPKPKLVPFAFEDNLLFRDKWIVLNKTETIWKIMGITNDGIYVNGYKYSYKTLFEEYKFEDGSVCGKCIIE